MNVFDLFVSLKADTSEYDKSIKNAENNASSWGSKLTGTLGTAAKVGFTAAAAAVGAATTAVAAFAKSSVSAYADYEQLVGGVETLFGTQGMTLEEYAESIGQTVSEAQAAYDTLSKAQDTVMENATNAWKTAGLSANDYMETVTSFAASLKQSVGDEVEAAEKADMAVQDMADNANKMGTDMEAIQNAYNGFAKQNYTMLDNLKLGYGGTQAEMERLLEDAQAISGVEYDISNLADVYDAIHVIQDDLGITGTTAEEAMHTISGAATATKSAWENVITAIAGGGELSEAIDGLITSIFGDGSEGSGLLANVIPRIQTVMDGIGQFIGEAAPYITEYLPQLISAILPPLLESSGSLISALVVALPSMLQAIWDAVSESMGTLITTIQDEFPNILQTVSDFVSTVFESLFSKIEGQSPSLLSTFNDLVVAVVDFLLQNLPTFLEKGVEIVVNLALGIIDSIPEIVGAITELILKLLATIVKNLPSILEKGFEIVVELVAGILKAIPKIVAAVPNMYRAMLNAITSLDWLGIGTNIVSGIANGITNGVSKIVDAAKSVAQSALNSAKSFLGIHSPSTVFEEQVGKMVSLGMGVGIENNAPTDEVSSMIDNLIDYAQGEAKDITLPLDISAVGETLITNGGEQSYNDSIVEQIRSIVQGINEEIALTLTAPIYIGNEYLETAVIKAINNNNYRTGGR